MSTLVPIPKLGQSEETVKIEKWRVKEGDKIKKGDILFEVETDKAVLEVESQFEGTLLKIIIPAGREVPVMATCAVLGNPGEEIPKIEIPKAPEKKPEAKRPAEAKVALSASPAKSAAAPAVQQVQQPVYSAPAFKAKPSPRARKFAGDYLIDLDKVSGTGGDVGRVTEADVKNYLEASGYKKKLITPTAFNLAKKEKLELLAIEGSGDNGRVTIADVKSAVSEKPREFSTMRKVIARRLTESKQRIPHFYVTAAIDMTEVAKKRKVLKEQGINLSVNVFIIKAVALALKEFPMLNAESDGITAKYKSKVNVGVAVSLESGLVVPVLRNTDKKALDEIQAEVAEFAEKARTGKLQPEDMKGGTFTISNMGMLNVENFAAIINPGESAILAVSSAAPTPVVKDGQIVIRDMMKVTVSADHRVVDGSDAAKFANALRLKLESVEFLNKEI
ncbi:MAG: dihydrolipoamide acetyltransferase family protein [Victivallales bacterium]